MMQTRAREWPHGMTATATHDTKRGEDARARIMALAEIPGEWTSAVARWKLLNAPHVLAEGDFRAPSATFEYMLYQALFGAWQPDDASFAERMQEYALKAAREGKQETSWLNPHEPYEAGVKSFIARILDPALSGEFLDSLQTLAQRLSLLGALNSLSQITLKATMPGVPDFYQGTELWDFSLVDPDNRRPVDFAARARLLETLEEPDWDRLVREWPNGHLKLAWTRQLLKLRTELADVFTDGDYEPLEVTGQHRDHFIAFARRHGRDAAIVVVPRWFAEFTDHGRNWPASEMYDAALNVSGYAVEGFADADATQLRLSDLLAHLPVAVLKARFTGAAKPAAQAQPGISSSWSVAACRGCGSRLAPLRRSAAAAMAARLPPARDPRRRRHGRPPPARAREPGRSCGCLPIAPRRRSAPARWWRRATAPSSGGAWLLRVPGYAESKPRAAWSFA